MVYLTHCVMSGQIATHPAYAKQTRSLGIPWNLLEKLNPDPGQAPVVTKPRWSLPSLAEKLIKRACKIRLAMSYGLHKIAIITLTAPLVLLVVSTAESKDQIGKLFIIAKFGLDSNTIQNSQVWAKME